MKPETLAKRIVERVREKFGKDAATVMGSGDQRAEVSEVIPTGIEVVDRYLLGVGGLAVGKLHEVFGEEGSGKSAFAYAALAGAQREGGVAVIVETEEALSSDRATVFGLDLGNLVVIQPDYMEQAMEAMVTLLKAIPANADGPTMLAWDSIAATQTKREWEDGMDAGAEMGERARMLSRFCREIVPLARAKRAVLLFVNQTRQRVGVMYGDPTTTPGGNAVKFHAHFRLALASAKGIKDDGVHTGKYVRATVRKSRFTEPHRTTELRLDYASGWNDTWATLNHAKDRKLLDETAKGAKAHDAARKALGWAAATETK